MHKRTDTFDLDIPKDDIDCWERYPRHRWVYELSRLLDIQNIKWSPYEVISLPERELNIDLISEKPLVRQPGYIYVNKPQGQCIISEIFIIKGEIKEFRQFDYITHNELDSTIGEVELRINAFVTLHFQKFTGVISIETHSNELFRIRLKPFVDPVTETNIDIIKLIRRIYKKIDTTFNGPSDQVLLDILTT